jgi:hypothetical protein
LHTCQLVPKQVFGGRYYAVGRTPRKSGARPRIVVRSSRCVGELAGWFITTFVPIALAYDVAHNLSFLALGAQYLIPILSDPLGIGWDLFGTKLYLIDTTPAS